jgi:peptidoglycan lytic transglycosylase G
MGESVAPRPATDRRPRRRRVAVLLGLALLGLASFEAGRAVVPPAMLREGPRTVEILPQQGLLGVARILAESQVIRSQLAFVTLAVLRGTARSLKAGEYEIPQGASLLTTLQLIELGKVKPHLIVLPEGFTIRELARLLEAERIAEAGDVLRVATDPFFTQGLGIEADSLEGYLFPDTYRVTRGMRVEEVLGRMVQRFREKIGTPEVQAQASARGLSLHALVTLASIIEKEAVVADERPLIAGVFWNRLRRDMPLQADPTVAYAVGRDGRAPTREDLQVDHPFNTYRYRGLPPGPIANPGRASVDAALAPASVPYLYFVSIDDRRHHFSATLEEHNQAVARYRQARGRSGGA